MSERKAVDVVVHGVVQGVGFRWSAMLEAQRLGVAGWIRNNDDDTVGAHYEGTGEQVAAMLEWTRRGPRSAVVETVDTQMVEPTGIRSFDVR